MTQDEELIALAVQADLCDEYGTVNYEYGYRAEIVTYGKLVTAKEREILVQLLIRLADSYEAADKQGSAQDIRMLIDHVRARGVNADT